MQKTILHLLIFVLLGGITARAAEKPTPPLPDDGPSLGDNQEAHGFGALTRRFKVFILSIPVMVNEGSIDDMVGKRDTLEPGTRKKIDALSPRIRMEQYTFFTEHIHHLHLNGPGPGGESPHGELMPMTLDNDRSTTFLENSQNTLIHHFSTSELVDLGVYKLSEKNFFATSSDKAWNRTKKTVVRYDIPLGVVAAAVMLAKDDLSLRTSGWLFQFFDDRLRLGWYLNAQDMGVHWRPTFDIGAVAGTKESTLRVGVIEHPGAQSQEVSRSIQMRFSHYWQELVSHGGGGHWEFTSNAAMKWIAESPDAHQRHDVVGNIEAYARRPLISAAERQANNQEAEYAIMLKTSVESNFADRVSVNGGITLENDKRHLQISLVGRFSQSVENLADPEASRADYFVGIFFGGDFIAEFERLKKESDEMKKKSESKTRP